ncbi:MAG: GntR family transcriptional regulator [Clostridiales bacterium]|jgi:DNA-binding transcriptional regulator YhcF (GntR family)|nr:GntR family transcriptional regulator [Clostridiales bacterium]
MQWELNTDKPVYLQLVEQIQAGIISGKYKPGDKLPSVRDLATQATVNPNTMQRAMTELERDGLVYSNRTIGRFITSDEELIAQLKKRYITQLVQEFLDKMKLLNIELNEIISYINQLSENNKA